MLITWLFQPQLPVIFSESEAILSHIGGCKVFKKPLRIQNVYVLLEITVSHFLESTACKVYTLKTINM